MKSLTRTSAKFGLIQSYPVWLHAASPPLNATAFEFLHRWIFRFRDHRIAFVGGILEAECDVLFIRPPSELAGG